MSRKKLFVILILAILTFTALFIKITHSIDQDEEMAIANIYRLSLNPRHSIFTSNWDSYQLSSCLVLPLIYLFKLINYNCLVIGFRILSIFLQLLFVVYLFIFIKKYFGVDTFIASVVSLLILMSTPKFLYTLDHSNQIMWFYTIFVIEMYKYIYPIDNKNNNKNIHIYLSGLSYSLAVLSHPGNILVLPIVFIYLLRKKNIKDFFKFLLPCFIAFVIFFLIFLKDNTLLFKDPMFFIYEFTNEGSHKSSLLGKINKLRMLMFVIIISIATLIKIFLRHFNLKELDDFNFPEIVFVGYCLASILATIIRNAPFAFQELFLFLWILLITKFYKIENISFLLMFQFYLLIIMLYFSNMGIGEQVNYLLPITMCIFSLYLNDLNLKKLIIYLLSFTCLLITTGYATRSRSPLTKTIFDNNTKNTRVLNGIKTEYDEKNYYDLLQNIPKNINNLMIISKLPRLLTYVYLETNIVSPSCITTQVFNNQHVDYLNYFNINDFFLLIDKEYPYKNYTDSELNNYLSIHYTQNTEFSCDMFDIVHCFK